MSPTTIIVTHLPNGWIRVEDTAWSVRATISPRGIVHPSKVLSVFALPRMGKVLEKCFELQRTGKCGRGVDDE